MKISETFGSKFYKAEDFTKKGTVLTITEVISVKVGTDERMVALFEEPDSKGLPLNKTNGLVLGEAFGDETDDWGGKKIRVTQGKTMYQGKSVPCIVVASAED